MDWDSVFRDVARRAATAVTETMEGYRDGHHEDEDDITGALVGSIRAHVRSQSGPIQWNARVMRHRKGEAAEEKKSGADLLIHVALDTPGLSYSKGVLVQAKRNEPSSPMSTAEHKRLVAQCGQMLNITPAAFVFNYAKGGMRCGPALRVKGSGTDLNASLPLTPFRFFYELFRCTTGDEKITSHHFDKLKLPNALLIDGKMP